MKKNKEKSKEKLRSWQDKYNAAYGAYSEKLAEMDKRERLYRGTREIENIRGGSADSSLHVRNIVAEIIEAEVDSNIPQPKVTAMHKEDEALAKIIEDTLRNELSRISFEVINDEQERTCPIQGGSMFLTEWDSGKRTHTTVGALKVSCVHPKAFIPQNGVHVIEDMDYCFLLLSKTKKYIERRYGVSVEDEHEESPEIRTVNGADASDELVTQIVAYYRNKKGGIGVFSWAGETVLEDIEDYQARKTEKCAKCGAPGHGVCTYCGSEKFDSTDEEYREIYEDIMLTDGGMIPALTAVIDPVTGMVTEQYTRIPYYKPDIYPVSLRKNVSVYGEFLGDSDVDKIADQQNSIKKLSTVMLKKSLMGGSVVTLPEGMNIETTDEQLKVVRVKKASDINMINAISLQPDMSSDRDLEEKFYNEARDVTGITDSFQGRRDSTAVSAKAKEFAAAQTAGRLESKRIMKNACYAYLFECMFKYLLAYTDEPRPVIGRGRYGEKEYRYFNVFDFLKKDAAGEYYWNTDFIFDCDSAAPLANDRTALWQETRSNFLAGALGDPSENATQVFYWRQMENLHYPGASETRAYLEDRANELMREKQNQQSMMYTQPGLVVPENVSAVSNISNVDPNASNVERRSGE